MQEAGKRCLVVGADRLGSLNKFKKLGVGEVVHWSGRSRRLPSGSSNVDLVLVYTSFASHATVRAAKEFARERGIPLVFLSRGLSELGSGRVVFRNFCFGS